MLETELIQLVKKIQLHHAELQIIELKAAAQGCPTRLYDTLSSFSNQDDGGIIVFGVDERRDYEVVGVYDVQDLMKHVVEQCNQIVEDDLFEFCKNAWNETAFGELELLGS